MSVFKDEVKAAVAKLLELKAKYKEVTGVDLAPAPSGGKKGKGGDKKAAEQPKENTQKAAAPAVDGDAIKAQVDAQGELVRSLKASGGGAVSSEIHLSLVRITVKVSN